MGKTTKDYYISQLEVGYEDLMALAQNCLDYFIKQGIYPEYFELPRKIQQSISHGKYVIDVMGNEHYGHE